MNNAVGRSSVNDIGLPRNKVNIRMNSNFIDFIVGVVIFIVGVVMRKITTYCYVTGVVLSYPDLVHPGGQVQS